MSASKPIRPGIVNIEYFSGAQVAVFIGDVWVDEITSIAYQVSQQRAPLYGYADQLFRDVSKGQVFIQGQFSINFKEAGYLWLVLNRYRELMRKLPSTMEMAYEMKPLLRNSPFKGNTSLDSNIEMIIDGEVNSFERNRALAGLADYAARNRKNAYASLSGFPNINRATATSTQGGQLGTAEAIFETFENRVWQLPPKKLDEMTRRCDDPNLSPFDIYIAYGDFNGTDYDNHTIQRLRDVYITGAAKQIVISGEPLQEIYSFIAKNLV